MSERREGACPCWSAVRGHDDPSCPILRTELRAASVWAWLDKQPGYTAGTETRTDMALFIAVPAEPDPPADPA